MRTTRFAWVSALALLAAFALAGCGGGGGGGGGGGNGGGGAAPTVVNSADGQASVSIPNGSSAPTAITITPSAQAGAPNGATVAKTPGGSNAEYAITPTAAGPFSLSPTLSITVDPATVPAGDAPQIYIYQAPNWVLIPGNTFNGSSVSAPVTQYATYGVFAIPALKFSVNGGAATGTPQTPFTQNSSLANITYSVSAANSANRKIIITLVLDHPVTPGDLHNITLNYGTGDQIFYYTNPDSTAGVLQTAPAGAITYSGNQITVDTSKIPAIPVPDLNPGDFFTIALHVATVEGGGSNNNDTAVQLQGQMPAVGSSQTVNTTYGNRFFFVLNNQTLGS